MNRNVFDKRIHRENRMFAGLFIAGMVINLAVLGGIVWLVVTLLKHFGVIA